MSNSLETERKYLIRMPNVSFLASRDNYTVSEIEQIYLPTLGGVTRRVRMRRYADKIQYTENSKLRLSPMTSEEREREITEDEYLDKKREIADGYTPLYKTRHTFSYFGRTLEIDVYPDWKSTAVLEIELEGEQITPEIPSEIEIIAEVTGDKRYSNHSMAKSFPNEPN